jgi:NADPH-dependent 2,4-dienoyl-CoA reductase/sulfur reductase-like enzyme
VYAAGDCTECTDISSGARRVLAILPNAYMQGHAAGVNMAGGEEDFDCAVPMNSAGFFGLHVMTAGSYDGECDDMSPESGIKRFYVKDGYLTGFILVGQTERAGIYTGLIRNRVPLSEIDFELMKKIPSNLIFSSKIRKKRFGKVV